MRLKIAKSKNKVLSRTINVQEEAHKLSMEETKHHYVNNYGRAYELYKRLADIVREANENSILLDPKTISQRDPHRRITIVPDLRPMAFNYHPDSELQVEYYHNIIEYLHTDFREDGMNNRTHFYVRLDRPEDSAMWRSAYAFDSKSLPYVDEPAINYIAKDLWNYIKQARMKNERGY